MLKEASWQQEQHKFFNTISTQNMKHWRFQTLETPTDDQNRLKYKP